MLLLTTSTTTTTTTQPSFHCRACLFCLFVPGFRTPFSLAGSSTRTLHSTPRLERCRQTCPCPGSSARSATSTSKSSVSGVCGRSSSSCFESSLSRLNERQTGACSLRCQTGSSGFQVSLAGCRERGGGQGVCVCLCVCVCVSVCVWVRNCLWYCCLKSISLDMATNTNRRTVQIERARSPDRELPRQPFRTGAVLGMKLLFFLDCFHPHRNLLFLLLHLLHLLHFLLFVFFAPMRSPHLCSPSQMSSACTLNAWTFATGTLT